MGEKPGSHLDGIGPLLVDLASAMSAQHAAGGEQERLGVLFGSLPIDRLGHLGLDAAGATDVEDPLLLAVEVDQKPALDVALLEAEGPGEAGLLLHGEDALKRAVECILVSKEAEDQGNGDAIVRPEGGPLCLEDVAVSHEGEWIGGKIMNDALILHTDHVHMPLQGY